MIIFSDHLEVNNPKEEGFPSLNSHDNPALRQNKLLLQLLDDYIEQFMLPSESIRSALVTPEIFKITPKET